MSPLFPRDLTSKGTLKMSGFFRMHVVATEGPISLPAGDFDNANFMTRALERLGLVPAGPLSALVASGHQLGRSGIKIDLYAVNRALARTGYSTMQKIAFKNALTRHGLM
jgi:hypothetical protein